MTKCLIQWFVLDTQMLDTMICAWYTNLADRVHEIITEYNNILPSEWQINELIFFVRIFAKWKLGSFFFPNELLRWSNIQWPSMQKYDWKCPAKRSIYKEISAINVDWNQLVTTFQQMHHHRIASWQFPPNDPDVPCGESQWTQWNSIEKNRH